MILTYELTNPTIKERSDSVCYLHACVVWIQRDLRRPGKVTAGNKEEYNWQGMVEIFQYGARRNRATGSNRYNGKSV